MNGTLLVQRWVAAEPAPAGSVLVARGDTALVITDRDRASLPALRAQARGHRHHGRLAGWRTAAPGSSP
jgi:hypothetical protein